MTIVKTDIEKIENVDVTDVSARNQETYHLFLLDRWIFFLLTRERERERLVFVLFVCVFVFRLFFSGGGGLT